MFNLCNCPSNYTSRYIIRSSYIFISVSLLTADLDLRMRDEGRGERGGRKLPVLSTKDK